MVTGEGIHHAMEGGKMAAKFLCEALDRGNYEKDCMYIYHTRWMEKFGYDFKWYETVTFRYELNAIRFTFHCVCFI